MSGSTHYLLDSEQSYEKLYRTITNQPETTKPELGKLKRLEPRKRDEHFLKPEKQLKALSITVSPDSTILYEMEQTVLLDSFSPFIGKDMAFDMPDPVSSTLTELDNWLNRYSYDILIISAHGSENGKLMFEDENGNEISVGGAQIADKLKSLEKKPSIVIFSACHSAKQESNNSKTSLIAPAQELFETGSVAAVVGMSKAISQLAAIDFNKGFIHSLLEGDNINNAFNHARKSIKDGEVKRLQDKGGNWPYIDEDAIPVLFIQPGSEDMGCNHFHDARIEREKLISADFEGAKYVERGFTGRRNELREIMGRILNNKEGRIVVKGPGGVGKSAITTRVCANLKNSAWELLIFVGVISIDKVISKIFAVMEKSGIDNANEIANRLDIDWQKKLRFAIKNFLADKNVAIIFDNFEDNQEEESGKVKNRDLKEFIEICNELAGHESILIITTRHKIAGLLNPVELKDFSPVETRKLFLQYKTLAKLTGKQIAHIHKKIGANPRVLELLEPLATEEFGGKPIDPETLEDIIDEITEKVIGDKEIEDGFAPWFINRLISYLNKEERELLKTISLYRQPVKSEGLFTEKNIIRRAREKLQRLSLTVYIPDNTYFAHRLTSGYVVNNLFEKDELKENRKKWASILKILTL